MDPDIQRHTTNSRMSKAVAFGGLVFLSGQTSGGTELSTIEEQTAEALRRIEAQLVAAGSSKARILNATIYLRSIEDFGAMNKVWEAWLPSLAAPARTTVEAAMASPHLKVEISAMAACL